MEFSGEFPVMLFCETVGILRSSFYSWKKKLSNPSSRTKTLSTISCCFGNTISGFPLTVTAGLMPRSAWIPSLFFQIPMLINAVKQMELRAKSSIISTRSGRSIPNVSKSSPVRNADQWAATVHCWRHDSFLCEGHLL